MRGRCWKGRVEMLPNNCAQPLSPAWFSGRLGTGGGGWGAGTRVPVKIPRTGHSTFLQVETKLWLNYCVAEQSAHELL